MTYVRAAIALLVLLTASPLSAQWQTSNHSVPIGRGAGATGFKSVAPGASGLPFVSQGASADPTYQALANAGLAQMPATTIKCNSTGSTANAADCTNPIVAGMTLNPTASSLNPGLSVNQSVSGNSGFPLGNSLNLLFISSDNAALTGPAFLNGFAVSHIFGGSSAQGGRQAIFGVLQLSAATSGSNLNRNYVGVNGTAYATAPDGGTNTGAGALGAMFGFAGWGDLQSGATNFLNVSGGEVNFSIRTGASARYKTGLQLVEHALDTVSAASVDAALAISAQSGAIGLNTGIVFTDMSGIGPVKSTGTLIGSANPNSTSLTAANGVDLSGYTFTGAAFKSTNFSVGAAGYVTANGINLTIAGAGSATGGAATALPALPSAYITIQINGTNFKIPVYNP